MSQTSRRYTVVINDPIEITTPSLPGGTRGQAYGPVQMQAQGGVGAIVWSLEADPAQGEAVPPGLTISPDGVISGTPSQGGSYSFWTAARDAFGAEARMNVGAQFRAGC